MRARAPQLYLRVNAGLAGSFQLLRGVLDGVWLGLASRETLHATDAAFYAGQSQYTDEAYTRGGLKDWEDAAITAHFAGCRRVVVTGAGGGREVLALAQRGIAAVGLEPNADMVAFGSRLLAEHAGASLVVAPRDGWPRLDGRFDGVVVGWGSYTHIVGRARRVAFLRQARLQVGAGAPLLVSVYTRPAGTLYHRVVHKVSTTLRRLLGREPTDLGDGFAPMYAHHFTRGELAAELAEGGFDLAAWNPVPFAHAVARAV